MMKIFHIVVCRHLFRRFSANIQWPDWPEVEPCGKVNLMIQNIRKETLSSDISHLRTQRNTETAKDFINLMQIFFDTDKETFVEVVDNRPEDIHGGVREDDHRVILDIREHLG